MNKKELFRLAKQDVYHAIALHVAMCNGFIEVSNEEEFMESYYYLKFWHKKLGNGAPPPLVKAIKRFEDFILKSGLIEQQHLEFWFEEKAKEKGDFQVSSSSAASEKPTPKPKEEKPEDYCPFFVFFPQNGGLPS